MAKSVDYIIQVRDRFSRNLAKFQSMIKKSGEVTKKFRKQLKLLGNKMASIGRNASLKFSLPIIGALTLMSKEAIDAQETFSKFDTVFENVADQANKVAKELKDSFGLASVDAKKLLSDTGDLLVGFGFTEDAALDMSKKVQELAVDLASFTNIQGGAKRASDALTKSLTGERESLKTLGIVVNESLIKEKLQIKGLSKLTGLALKQAQALATLEIAYEQSVKAIGDFDRTQGLAANQIRIANARFKDLRIAIGTNLIPIITMLVNKLTPLLLKTTKWIEENKNLVKIILSISAAIAVIGPALIILSSLLSILGSIAIIAGSVGISLGLAFGIFVGIPLLIGAAIIAFKKFKIIRDIVGFVLDGFKLLGSFIIGMMKDIVSSIMLPFNAIKGLINLLGKAKNIGQFGIINDQINKDAQSRIPIQQSQSQQVDVSGIIGIKASKGTEVEKFKMFNKNLGTNVSFGAL